MILQVYVLRDCEEEDQEEMEEYDVLDQTDIEFKEWNVRPGFNSYLWIILNADNISIFATHLVKQTL